MDSARSIYPLSDAVERGEEHEAHLTSLPPIMDAHFRPATPTRREVLTAAMQSVDRSAAKVVRPSVIKPPVPPKPSSFHTQSAIRSNFRAHQAQRSNVQSPIPAIFQPLPAKTPPPPLPPAPPRRLASLSSPSSTGTRSKCRTANLRQRAKTPLRPVPEFLPWQETAVKWVDRRPRLTNVTTLADLKPTFQTSPPPPPPPPRPTQMGDLKERLTAAAKSFVDKLRTPKSSGGDDSSSTYVSFPAPIPPPPAPPARPPPPSESAIAAARSNCAQAADSRYVDFVERRRVVDERDREIERRRKLKSELLLRVQEREIRMERQAVLARSLENLNLAIDARREEITAKENARISNLESSRSETSSPFFKWEEERVNETSMWAEALDADPFFLRRPDSLHDTDEFAQPRAMLWATEEEAKKEREKERKEECKKESKKESKKGEKKEENEATGEMEDVREGVASGGDLNDSIVTQSSVENEERENNAESAAEGGQELSQGLGRAMSYSSIGTLGSLNFRKSTMSLASWKSKLSVSTISSKISEANRRRLERKADDDFLRKTLWETEYVGLAEETCSIWKKRLDERDQLSLDGRSMRKAKDSHTLRVGEAARKRYDVLVEEHAATLKKRPETKEAREAAFALKVKEIQEERERKSCITKETIRRWNERDRLDRIEKEKERYRKRVAQGGWGAPSGTWASYERHFRSSSPSRENKLRRQREEEEEEENRTAKEREERRRRREQQEEDERRREREERRERERREEEERREERRRFKRQIEEQRIAVEREERERREAEEAVERGHAEDPRMIKWMNREIHD